MVARWFMVPHGIDWFDRCYMEEGSVHIMKYLLFDVREQSLIENECYLT